MRDRSRLPLLVCLAVTMAVLGCSNPGAAPVRTASSPASKPEPPTTAGVMTLLAAGKLPIDAITVYTVESDRNHLLGRPGQYIAKMAWHDIRVQPPVDPAVLGVDDGGSVEIFASPEDRAPREDYVRRVTRSVSAFAEYTDEIGRFTLLRQTHFLAPDQAAEYRRALVGLK